MEAYYTCSYIAALHSGRVFWLDKYTQYTHWTKNPDFAHCAVEVSKYSINSSTLYLFNYIFHKNLDISSTTSKYLLRPLFKTDIRATVSKSLCPCHPVGVLRGVHIVARFWYSWHTHGAWLQRAPTQDIRVSQLSKRKPFEYHYDIYLCCENRFEHIIISAEYRPGFQKRCLYNKCCMYHHIIQSKILFPPFSIQ